MNSTVVLEKLDELIAFVTNYKPPQTVISGLNRARSTTPSKTRSWESVLLNSTMDNVWKAVRDCKFEFLSNVDKVKTGMYCVCNAIMIKSVDLVIQLYHVRLII